MKTKILGALVAGFVALAGIPQAGAEEKLERGKDRMDVPAIGAGLCLHNLFQSGMVIQRDKPIRIWGWAEPSENVSVTFGEKTQSSTAAPDRSWKVELPALPASSEPHRLVVQGKAKTIKLEDILIGDVWLLGGQSNMGFPIYKVDGGSLEIVSANFKNIRIFTVPQQNGADYKKSFPCLYQWSDWSEEHYRQGYWDVCSPATVAEMSAIGYIFAGRIHMATEIPIGVIDASRGGTCIETWLPLELLKTIDTPEVKAVLSDWDKQVAAFNPQKDLEARIKEFNEWAASLKAQGKEIPANSTPPSDLRPEPRVLLPTADQHAVTWRYTFAEPAADWFKADFNDSAWKEGAAGFGTRGTPNAVLGTVWNTPDVWLRTAFDYDGADFKTAAVRIHHDEDATVYLNGEAILKATWYITEYELIDATPAVRKALHRGRNVLAVRCHQTSGGQYVDVGIILDAAGATQAELPLPPLKPLFDYPVRDTSVCVGGDGNYYLTGTTGHPTWWKTNEGIRVWRSADLKTWMPLGLVWTIEKDGTWQKEFRDDNRAIWAPEIHYLKGTFWLTYCLNYGGTGVLRSTTGKAEGPYKDIKPDGPLTGEIDASLFQDDDGKIYFVYQNGKIARMKDDMTGLAETPRLLKPANAAQVGFEGAFLTKADGRYLLVCADFIGGSYHCMAASAKKIDGPYGDRYVAVPHGGHNMFFKDRSGQWWATFFGNDPRAPFRERPAMLQIEFGPDGRVRPKTP